MDLFIFIFVFSVFLQNVFAYSAEYTITVGKFLSLENTAVIHYIHIFRAGQQRLFLYKCSSKLLFRTRLSGNNNSTMDHV